MGDRGLRSHLSVLKRRIMTMEANNILNRILGIKRVKDSEISITTSTHLKDPQVIQN